MEVDEGGGMGRQGAGDLCPRPPPSSQGSLLRPTCDPDLVDLTPRELPGMSQRTLKDRRNECPTSPLRGQQKACLDIWGEERGGMGELASDVETCVCSGHTVYIQGGGCPLSPS